MTRWWTVMWMPDWLYERLPVLYVSAGAASLALLGSSAEVTPSAGLLFAAAWLTHARRRRSRRAARAARRAPPARR